MVTPFFFFYVHLIPMAAEKPLGNCNVFWPDEKDTILREMHVVVGFNSHEKIRIIVLDYEPIEVPYVESSFSLACLRFQEDSKSKVKTENGTVSVGRIRPRQEHVSSTT